MSRTAILSLDAEAAGKNTIRFHRALLAGETITLATATLQRRTATRPERWEDVPSDELTVTAAVVDAMADDGTTLLGADQAVQVLAVDADDDTFTPARGSEYRWLVIADVSGRDVPLVAKNPVTLRP
jgi:hypothetical protein